MTITVRLSVELPDSLDGGEVHRYERALVGLIGGATWENEGLPAPTEIASRVVIDVDDPRGQALIRASVE